MSTSPFDGLKPARLFAHFQALTQIPRGSGNEAAAAAHVMAWAKAHGFAREQDGHGNVLVRVPATAGKERAPTVVLQGHLDMVCEKNSDVAFDFTKDAIRVRREGDCLGATGTTLGADNGVGLAAAMAVAEDPDVERGALEILCTVDEETGLTGAQGLEPGSVRGKIMLNLDSEEDGVVYVGCAGGADTVCVIPVERGDGSATALTVNVSGLKGGHSGLDINLGRGNAVKVLAWFLDRLRQRAEFELCALSAGDKHNAIPREGSATICVASAADRTIVDQVMRELAAELKVVYGKTDPHVKISLENGAAAGATARPLTRASRDTVIDVLIGMPHGVLAMSQAVAGLVETSTNLASVRLEDQQLRVLESSRSSVDPMISKVQQGLVAITRLAGGAATPRDGYPGWQPNMDSDVLKCAIRVHETLFGKAPGVKAIHAGLECGIIGEKMRGMDMLSMGPQIENPHSPSELVRISTVERFYKFLTGVLAELAA